MNEYYNPKPKRVPKKYKVEPDMAMFGKALGNGYPISAVIGNKKVMSASQNSFISSTFFTERLGFVAAQATLKEMQRIGSQETIKIYGETIKNGWQELANKHNLSISVSGLDPLAHFDFLEENAQELNTFFIYKLLYSGFLAGTSVYTTTAYSKKIIGNYLKEVDMAFQEISRSTKGSLKKKYNFKLKHSGFSRLT